ncbi:MAG: N-acetyltransferase family protein [Acidimicrobiia bacterium]
MSVRPMRRDDAESLGRLYQTLSFDDRYHRFFSAYEPSPDVLDHMAAVGDEHGCGFVAVLTDADGRDELVGEASFTPLPNGNGELAITVASGWRGWLGPYLLDTLVEAAAERGVPNLEADIMYENTKMLALMRARGCVGIEHADPSILRVAIGAAEPVMASRRKGGEHEGHTAQAPGERRRSSGRRPRRGRAVA